MTGQPMAVDLERTEAPVALALAIVTGMLFGFGCFAGYVYVFLGRVGS